MQLSYTLAGGRREIYPPHRGHGTCIFYTRCSTKMRTRIELCIQMHMCTSSGIPGDLHSTSLCLDQLVNGCAAMCRGTQTQSTMVIDAKMFSQRYAQKGIPRREQLSDLSGCRIEHL